MGLHPSCPSCPLPLALVAPLVALRPLTPLVAVVAVVALPCWYLPLLAYPAARGHLPLMAYPWPATRGPRPIVAAPLLALVGLPCTVSWWHTTATDDGQQASRAPCPCSAVSGPREG